jgi:hypothetical protein
MPFIHYMLYASSSRSSGAAAGPATGGDSGYDVIVGSDLAYHRDTGPSLLYTIKALSSPATVTLIALPHRSTQNAAEQIAAMAQASGEKTHLLCHLILQMIILPRQARDKHRESTQKKERRFVSAGLLSRVVHEERWFTVLELRLDPEVDEASRYVLS